MKIIIIFLLISIFKATNKPFNVTPIVNTVETKKILVSERKTNETTKSYNRARLQQTTLLNSMKIMKIW